MEAMALYRKWRPQEFQTLKGQDVIRDTLLYALTHDQLNQAYLFCGPRGTGKTTTARLIAKLINCVAEASQPCNRCEACRSITDGSNIDVLEMDAASNRGIDEVRQLREAVRFAPTSVRYKVFIIDEVHMLTREAFNALLKTLEEPPAHTVFILATTESHKIPPTIISRCQRYDFQLASIDTLTDHVIQVSEKESIPMTKEAARFLARLGEGSFRDTLSLLDQAKAAHIETGSLEEIEKLYGFVPSELVIQCLVAILSGDGVIAHSEVDTVIARGGSIAAFGNQLLQLTQQGIEALVTTKFDDISPDLQQALRTQGTRGLIIWVELLLKALNEMKQSPIARLPLDIAIVKFVSGSTNEKPPVLVMPQVKPVTAAAPSVTPRSAEPQPVAVEANVSQSPSHEESRTVLTETVSVPVAVTVETIDPELWQLFLKQLKESAPSLVTSLSHAKMMGNEEGIMKVAVRYKMHADKINQVRNREMIETVLAEVLGQPLKIEAHVVKDLVIEEDVADVSEIFDFEE